MKLGQLIALSSLLARASSEKGLSSYLSEKYLEKLAELPKAHEGHIPSDEEQLFSIHYSWFIPLIETYSDTDKVAILSVLSDKQFSKLSSHFLTGEKRCQFKTLGVRYLRQTLFKLLTYEQKEFVPIAFLPENSFNALLKLSKPELTTLIDYLGLRDLSTEFKQIVKASQIKEIHKALSTEQKNYLKEVLKSGESVKFSSLKLDQWNGTEEMLKKVLHQRGLNRLGKALFGCHPSLFWHICHRLDVGRAHVLRKLMSHTSDEVQSVLETQVMDLIHKLQGAS
ncbi:MAG: hypothetical protein SP1CHLAM54_13100 [Chlamydiia bacterium]|nr:hypothetical protein [Chlamydiia bacterium]MCH9616206.1 hypothetical protein [Chlamydiia bacterium]MCH9629808.1 hypothetical protein [Chlamydiia bacterium]